MSLFIKLHNEIYAKSSFFPLSSDQRLPGQGFLLLQKETRCEGWHLDVVQRLHNKDQPTLLGEWRARDPINMAADHY